MGLLDMFLNKDYNDTHQRGWDFNKYNPIKGWAVLDQFNDNNRVSLLAPAPSNNNVGSLSKKENLPKLSPVLGNRAMETPKELADNPEMKRAIAERTKIDEKPHQFGIKGHLYTTRGSKKSTGLVELEDEPTISYNSDVHKFVSPLKEFFQKEKWLIS